MMNRFGNNLGQHRLAPLPPTPAATPNGQVNGQVNGQNGTVLFRRTANRTLTVNLQQVGNGAHQLVQQTLGTAPIGSPRAFGLSAPSEASSSAMPRSEREKRAIGKMSNAVIDTLKQWENEGASGQKKLSDLKMFCSLSESSGDSGATPSADSDQLRVANSLLLARWEVVGIRVGDEGKLLREMQGFLSACLNHDEAAAKNCDVNGIITFCKAFNKVDEISLLGEAKVPAEVRRRPAPTLTQMFPWARTVLDIGNEIFRARFAGPSLLSKSGRPEQEKEAVAVTSISTSTTTTTTTTSTIEPRPSGKELSAQQVTPTVTTTMTSTAPLTTTTAHLEPPTTTPTAPQSTLAAHSASSGSKAEPETQDGDTWMDWSYEEEIDDSTSLQADAFSDADSDTEVDSAENVGTRGDREYDYESDSPSSQSGVPGMAAESEPRAPRDAGDE